VREFRVTSDSSRDAPAVGGEFLIKRLLPFRRNMFNFVPSARATVNDTTTQVENEFLFV
jgi:hypothetical protein